MDFKDRVANKPNRIKLTYEDTGAVEYVLAELADEPIEEGTPLNKNTFDKMMAEASLGFVEDNTYVGCFYRMVGGEKEWLNPPMEVGREYRTIKRYNSFPVYTKRIDYGYLRNEPANMNGVTADKVISFYGISHIDKTYADNFPIFSKQGVLQAIAFLEKDKIVVNVLSNHSAVFGYYAQFDIEYVK